MSDDNVFGVQPPTVWTVFTLAVWADGDEIESGQFRILTHRVTPSEAAHDACALVYEHCSNEGQPPDAVFPAAVVEGDVADTSLPEDGDAGEEK